MPHPRRTKYSGGKIPSHSDLRGRVPTGMIHRKENKNSKRPQGIKTPFICATWNVRTLQDSAKSSHPERRTALISQELHRLSVDIAALSETRLLGEGSIKEQHYTFFWKGHPAEGKKLHGVGFAIRNEIASVLEDAPQGVSERLMTLRLRTADQTYINVISAYAPTLDASTELKDRFYQSLERTLTNIPKSERIILLGDFNARVGKDATIWKGVLGRHGIGNMNANGEMLLTTCTEHDLTITNTIFRQHDKFKGSWRHPRSGHWHLLDYVIVRRRDIKEVRTTKARLDIECWTDHRIVVSKIQLSLKTKHKRFRKNRRRHIRVERLTDPEVTNQLKATVENSLANISFSNPPTSDSYWTQLKKSIQDASIETLGLREVKRQPDWFNENAAHIEQVLERKRRALQTMINQPDNEMAAQEYNTMKNEARREIRSIKNIWWRNKALEIQSYADQHNSRCFFQALKEVYGPVTSNLRPLRDNAGNLLTNEAQIRRRWREHYSTILNQQNNVDLEVINLIPQYNIAEHLSAPLTVEEISVALSQLKNNKAAGSDGIPAEILKSASSEIIPYLKTLFDLIWEQEHVPQDFQDALIVNIYKKKGDVTDCGNYRGISLLVVAGKVLARALANRLLPHIDKLLPNTQSGFRPGRSTVDMIFTLRQLQEKTIEQHTELYIAFIDVAKAFDSVNRSALWTIMSRFGIPKKFVAVCKSLHENNMARVSYNGETTETFATHTGVRQGCVLAPLLFNIFLAALSILVDRSIEARGVGVRYRYDGGLFNLTRLRAATKSRVKFITELMYADDCALVSHSADQLQQILNGYSWAYQALGLRMNINKTKIMSTPNPIAQDDRITINEQQLEEVESFNYLGSILSQKANIDLEIQNRIRAASRAFWKLKSKVFHNHDLTFQTKMAVYRAVITPTLTYGCETWVPYSRHIKALERLQQRQLRQIMGIRWFHRVSNKTVLDRAESTPIEILVTRTRLRWAGHVTRMNESRLEKAVLYGELCQGRRRQGGQRLRFKDILHENLKSIRAAENWEIQAEDRCKWRRIINNYKGPRTRIRNRPAPGNFDCPECGRTITSRIGLLSHQRTHRR